MTTRPSRLVAAVVSCLLGHVAAMHLEQPPSAKACSKLPAFMIGGHPSYLDGRPNSYHPSSVTKEEMRTMLHDMHGPHQPEVAVVIVGPSAHTMVDPDHFTSLKRFVMEAPSSKVLPCLVRSDGVSMMDYLSSHQGNHHRPEVVNYVNLESHLSSSGEILGNNKMDVIVTSLPDHLQPYEVDTYLDQVQNQLSTSIPSGRYILIHAPEHHVDQPIYCPLTTPPPTIHRRLAPNDTDPSGWPYQTQYLYATPNLVAGLLTGVFLIATTWVGAQALFSLQGPSKWVDTKLPDGKEF